MLDTIVAIATAPATGGVAIVRISGTMALNIASKMFKPQTQIINFEPNKMYVGEIFGVGFIDYGMCVYFKAPKSFTGEDIIEFHCHGGIAIANGILDNCILNGARLAKNGEFTKRAFINGKLSLSAAEGMADMINSDNINGIKAGYFLYTEKLNNKINDIRDNLKNILATLYADIDFPEEDLSINNINIQSEIKKILNNLEQLLNTYQQTSQMFNGVNIGIVGKPNTGKSSLLNALLNYNKAIVTNIAGTTRDIVDGSIFINGYKFNLFDTAGIRESNDAIELIGVELSKNIIKNSDLLLFVLDINNINEDDIKIFNEIKNKKFLLILNKYDIKTNIDNKYYNIFKQYEKNIIYTSATTKFNIQKLKDMIFTNTISHNIKLQDNFIYKYRHKDVLLRTYNILKNIEFNLENDIIASIIKEALDTIGEISGDTANEEIINSIFSKFCVGK